MANFGFPIEFIQEVKRRNDIISVISKSLTLEKKGKNFWACCPFHFEKTPSFSINESEQYYHCFGCGESGDVIKFTEKYENVSFFEALKLLCANAGMTLPEISTNNNDLAMLKEKEKVLQALNLAKDYYISNLPHSEIANNYITKRKLSPEVVSYFGIGYSPDWQTLISHLESQGVSVEIMKKAGLVEQNEQGRFYDVFAHRLMFPILNAFGDCIGFTARTLDENSKFAKYRNSTQTIVFDKSRTIYNIHTIKSLKKSQNLDYIIICEGTIDVIAMFKAGFNNTVACLGTALTPHHAAELRRFTGKIILCLDGDSAGQSATYKAIDVLCDAGLQVRVVKLRDNLDPDEYLETFGNESLKLALKEAKDSIEYKLDTLSNHHNLKDNYEKNLYVTDALNVIKSLPSSAEQEIYLKIVSVKTDIPIDILRRDLNKHTTTQTASTVPSNEKPAEEPSLVSRPPGDLKAIQFVLSAVVHKQEYAQKIFAQNLVFQNSNYQKLFDFVQNCYKTGKNYTISSLFDYFDVENNPDIAHIINFNFSSFGDNQKVYFDECLAKITLSKLRIEQEKLLSEFKQERDGNKRREIADKLTQIAKEIKNGDR